MIQMNFFQRKCKNYFQRKCKPLWACPIQNMKFTNILTSGNGLKFLSFAKRDVSFANIRLGEKCPEMQEDTTIQVSYAEMYEYIRREYILNQTQISHHITKREEDLFFESLRVMILPKIQRFGRFLSLIIFLNYLSNISISNWILIVKNYT